MPVWGYRPCHGNPETADAISLQRAQKRRLEIISAKPDAGAITEDTIATTVEQLTRKLATLVRPFCAGHEFWVAGI